jgi:poly-gamma-glutamate synthesis protein (capsule biosynthesis protein)
MKSWRWSITAGAQDVSLLLVGDTNIQNREVPVSAFSNVLETLKEADVLFGHCEGLFSTPSADPMAPDIPHKDGWKHSHPSQVAAFVEAGFDAVSCASNVSFGRQAVLNSMEVMDSVGLRYCGIGRNREEARRPVLVTKKGITFGFLSYTSVFWHVGHAATSDLPGVSTIKAVTSYQPHPRVLEMPGAPAIVVTHPDPEELAAMEQDVRKLKEQADIVVVSCHWGVSSSKMICDYQKQIGRTAIEAGADIVIGHHPHVLQGVEIYKGKPIFYSLSNFAFDWEKILGRYLEGFLLRCIIREGKLASVSIVPAKRNEHNLITLLSPNEKDGSGIIAEMRELSKEFGTVFEVVGEEVSIANLHG